MERKHSLIDPATPLNELVERGPHLLPVLHRFGLDTCCGGSLPLEEAARRHGFAVEELIGALDEALREPGKAAGKGG